MLNNIHPTILYFAAGVASLSLFSLLHQSLFSPPKNTKNAQTVPSPHEARPRLLNPDVAESFPYPPAQTKSFKIPGTRDVSTPYGAIRVYEFGPCQPTATARRIIFLHGISTPSIALYPLAWHLAGQGCRVLLMDLFGRGWSGGPRDLPYDGRLYTSQILMALASSEDRAGWFGEGFVVAGYSLGGGLAMDFASWFPHLVQDLILIAPGGILRDCHISWQSKLLYSQGYLPESLIEWLVRRRLFPSDSTPTVHPRSSSESNDPAAVATAELPTVDNRSPKAMIGDQVDINGTLRQQLIHNSLFIPAFVSSIRCAPIHGQQDRWKLFGQHLNSSRKEVPKVAPSAAQLSQKKNVLLILGGQDPIVFRNEIEPDACEVLGRENLVVRVFEDAGHEVPMSHAKQVGEWILKIWGAE